MPPDHGCVGCYLPTQVTTIYVYQEYPRPMDRLARARVSEEDQVKYQPKFVAAMALSAWLQHEQRWTNRPVQGPRQRWTR